MFPYINLHKRKDDNGNGLETLGSSKYFKAMHLCFSSGTGVAYPGHSLGGARGLRTQGHLEVSDVMSALKLFRWSVSSELGEGSRKALAPSVVVPL